MISSLLLFESELCNGIIHMKVNNHIVNKINNDFIMKRSLIWKDKYTNENNSININGITTYDILLT